jgi:hypothetical protein
MPTPRFPWWIVLGGLTIAAGYLPTLATPFDFIDDGNLVYPAPPGTTLAGHVELWWAKVKANYDHLGPFRPVLWAHWELAANLFAADPLTWRAARLLWCALAAGMLLWLFFELRIHPVVALIAGAAAMWNPYRGEIWTSLTLGEGVAMPYALLGLVAARRAASSERPWVWDLVAIVGVVMALGCKNVFAALVPAQVVLRMWPDGVSLRDGWRRHGRRALLLTAPLLLPAAHFVYFKLNWHPGQYETHGPTVAQAVRILNAWKGAAGVDFLGAGLAGVALVVLLQTPWTAVRERCRLNHIVAALLLLAAGFCIYLPMDAMSGRYTLPAAWGLDILVALLLTAFIALPTSLAKRLAWAGLVVGLAALFVANLGRQEKFAARARLLWDVVEYIERIAPPKAAIAWVSGDSLRGELNVEEGIHFRWHLLNRGRGDVRVGLFDARGQAIDRVELPPLDREPTIHIAGPTADGKRFVVPYRLGQRQYVCHVSQADATTSR